MNEIGPIPRGDGHEPRSRSFVAADDAPAPRPRSGSPGGAFAGRGQGAEQAAYDPRSAVCPTSLPSEQPPAAGDSCPSQLPPREHVALSRSNSQATSSTNDADPVFTPPVNGGRLSPGTGSGHNSSQESQLLQLSQIAAAQERIPEDTVDAGAGAPSRKRMADGMVKHPPERSNVSPGQTAQMAAAGHSRNTSAVSVASTAGSRIGEVLILFLPSFTLPVRTLFFSCSALAGSPSPFSPC